MPGRIQPCGPMTWLSELPPTEVIKAKKHEREGEGEGMPPMQLSARFSAHRTPWSLEASSALLPRRSPLLRFEGGWAFSLVCGKFGPIGLTGPVTHLRI